MGEGTSSNDLSIQYKPRSDFINLSKLNVLVLARKLEANEGEESQGTSTPRGWIWENMVRVAETIAKDMSMDMDVEPTSDGDMRLCIVRKICIMGITSESASVTSMLSETLKSLSEEEWDWVAMTPEEIQNGESPEWCPPKDPRPEWRIKRDKNELSPVPKIYEENVPKETSEDFHDTTEEKLRQVEHVPGPKCRCDECEKLKLIEDKWIMKLETFYEDGLNSRDEVKGKSRYNWKSY